MNDYETLLAQLEALYLKGLELIEKCTELENKLLASEHKSCK